MSNILTLRAQAGAVDNANPFADAKVGSGYTQDATTKLWSITTPDAFNAAKAKVEPYLQKELKLELHQMQQKSMVQALTKPEKWLNEREKQIKGITTELSGPYIQAIEKYRQLYPIDEAVALANKEIKVLYDIKLNHLELIQPGASSLMQNQVFKNNVAVGEGKMLTSGLENADKSNYKKYYKQKYKNKKSEQQ